ncbi:hypothetical protein WI93_20855 [Burkholderia vietnamiensis]|nr:hypothetical protein WI93_20855 [Burkholderia vietnamiensis]
MQMHKARNMVRLGDATGHGGKVVEATDEVKHLGIPVALDQHGGTCPKYGGIFPVLASGPRTHRGRVVGYVGDKTGCGATVIGS